ncbi:hypothetical protein DID88_007303 [Monilinia fructigena]|uniref:Uncharacterized protein n=1 Tax=Monilinia fructigena TaxID=38457 RepID=A0A395J8Y8_9HELO|nr:hypothetical protein DID88_007303 [Monilinia fructigena]
MTDNLGRTENMGFMYMSDERRERKMYIMEIEKERKGKERKGKERKFHCTIAFWGQDILVLNLMDGWIWMDLWVIEVLWGCFDWRGWRGRGE